MAFTSNSDVFVSVNEAGINQIVRHVMLQRPSLFNYGTDAVIRNPELWCAPIEAAPAVHQRGNPLITREPPLPLMGTDWTDTAAATPGMARKASRSSRYSCR